jgi:hypothetical protein
MLLTNVCLAEQVFIDHCKHGCPVLSNGTETLVVRHLFVSSMNNNGLVQWLAYRVFAETVGVASLFPRTWQAEALVEAAANSPAMLDSSPRFVQPNLENSQDREYRVNEIRLLDDERGRLAPMTSFANTPYLNQLNLLSNMSPLPSDLRLGPWSRLDQAVNEQSVNGGYFFIVSGPLAAVSETNSKSAQFFKVVAQDNRLAAFLFPADSAPHVSYCQYQVNLDELEKLSQISFFPRFEAVWSEDLAADFGCTY